MWYRKGKRTPGGKIKRYGYLKRVTQDELASNVLTYELKNLQTY